MEITEKKLKFEETDLLPILGSNDLFLNMIENRFNAAIIVRGEKIVIKGNSFEVKKIEEVFKELIYILTKNGSLEERDVSTVLDLVEANRTGDVVAISDPDSVIYHGYRDLIRTRTPRQLEYCQKVRNNDLVFSIGPAGTGKTFLAVAMALAAMRRNEVSKIILSRPAVEAGESLGFLPGDLNEKLDPYIRPLTDALFYMLNPDKLKSLMEKQIIEITPLAYMRGRTLSNAFIILDEAQNATVTQMKMFLTRLGANSRAIVTGDITQIDLKEKTNSGLVDAKNVLSKIDGIEFVYFSNKDVVRHKLVAKIIKAYEKREKKEK